MKPTELTIEGTCFVQRPDNSFPGKVVELRDNWVRVIGLGEEIWLDEGDTRHTHFDEWFPIKTEKCRVVPS